jgi:hypothetical protein
MNIERFLVELSGLCWTIVYIDSIRIGFKEKTYAMPFWALALNIAWEFLYSVLGYMKVGLSLQIVINGIWFLFDVGLLYTYFRYGKKYFPKNSQPNWFYAWGILVLVSSFILQYAFFLEFGLLGGSIYSAFLQNLLMSVLFIVMLVQRGSSEGQTMTIAISKWIGTLAPTILYGIIGGSPLSEPNTFVLITGMLIVVFDLIYIGMLVRTKVHEKTSTLYYVSKT